MAQKYKHLLPSEIAIWDRVLANPPWVIVRAEYDVHLGEGAPINPAWPEWLKSQVKAVSRKRVDVIVHTPDDIYIVEIKPRAGMSALGQVLCYRELYIAEYQPTKRVRMVVIAERAESDVPVVYRQFDVALLLV